MATSPAKEKILKRIREALVQPVPLPFPKADASLPLYPKVAEDNVVRFAENFTKLQGRFSYCESASALQSQLTGLFRERGWDKIFCAEAGLQVLLEQIGIAPFDDLANCDASVTGCEFLVARTGSIVLSAAQQSGRTASVYAPVHICVTSAHSVVADLDDALAGLTDKYGSALPSFITFASGPSRTADIEKTLVTGVHGPKEVFCFIVDS